MNKVITTLLSIQIFLLSVFVGYLVLRGPKKNSEEVISLTEIVEKETEKKYDISRVIVLSGDSFDVTLKDEKATRVLAKLSLNSTKEAKEKVFDLLNHSESPKVRLLEKQTNGQWVVDFSFFKEGKEINLAEWLKSNNLVYK